LNVLQIWIATAARGISDAHDHDKLWNEFSARRTNERANGLGSYDLILKICITFKQVVNLSLGIINFMWKTHQCLNKRNGSRVITSRKKWWRRQCSRSLRWKYFIGYELNGLRTIVFAPDVQHENGSDEEQRHDQHGHGSAVGI